MYKLTEEQRNTLIYILDHLTVTGPAQGTLLGNAGAIMRSVKPETEPEPKKEEL